MRSRCRLVDLAIVVLSLAAVGCGDDLCPPGEQGCKLTPLVIVPASARLGVGRRQAFAANLPVRWKVEESDGGALDADGRYTAPMVTGTYHLIATNLADDRETVTVPITVTPLVVDLLAGHLGGIGNGDGVGPDARFELLSFINRDDAGNLYVSDTGGIRMVQAASGSVVTVASTSQDGPNALVQPRGLVPDGAGNLYVSDVGGGIREVALATGAVTSMALSGSPLSEPVGLTTDGANLYVSDSGDHTVKRIALSTGEVTVVAGTSGVAGRADGFGTAAQFSTPWGIATDRAGSLFVADQVGTVRKIDLETAEVTTLAAGLSGPFGLSVDGAGNVFVMDAYRHTVDKIVIATGEVSIVAGIPGACGNRDGSSTTATFCGRDVTADGTLLYIADGDPFNGGSIRKIDLGSRQVTTLAGALAVSGNADGVGDLTRFSSPGAMTTNGQGGVFMADSRNLSVRTIDPDSGLVGTLDKVGSIADLAFDETGGLYLTMNNAIRKLADGEITTLAGTADEGSEDGTWPGARFRSPRGIAVTKTSVFVADTYNFTIRQIDRASGMVTTIAGTAGQQGSQDGQGADARFLYPEGLVYDGVDSLYVADTGNHAIRRVRVTTHEVTTVAGTTSAGSVDGPIGVATFDGPYALAMDGRNLLYVAEPWTGDVRAIDLTAGMVSTVVGVARQRGVLLGPLPARLNGPAGLTVLSNGDLLVSDEIENSVVIVH